MKNDNYIKLNGQKIELTAEQIAEMQKSFGVGQVQLSKIEAEDTFKIGRFEFIVLKNIDGETSVILKGLYKEKARFGDNNNYKNSNADYLCQEFYKELAELIGTENILSYEVDMTSDDGLKDYGTIYRKASLLTANQYREFVDILDKHKLNAYWWLVTADSTPTHANANWVKCVAPSGDFGFNYYDINFIGVRPFCILNSSIFVSK